jgi:hypothetical protein
LCFLASSNPKNRLLRHFYPKQNFSHFSPFREREKKKVRDFKREKKKRKKKSSFFFCGVLKIEMVEVKIQFETRL